MGRRAAIVVCVVLWCALAAPAQDPPPSWLQQVSLDLAAQEYRFAWDEGGGLTAPNRAQGLRSHIGPSGLAVTPRVEGADWRLELRLARVGRHGAESESAAGTLAVDGVRGEIRRAALTEWFVNRPEGLEHGFTVPRPPAGAGRLVVTLAIGGNMLAFPQGYDGRGVEFRDAHGQPALEYDGLVVRDANGDEVPARFEIAPGELRIEIEDDAAVYPLEIDPNLAGAVWGVFGHWENDRFGENVSTAGDVNGDGYADVAIGVPSAYNAATGYRRGAVFVYYGSASGLANKVDGDWRAYGADTGDQLGGSVSAGGDINGDGYGDLVVGNPQVYTAPGEVWVYYGSAAGLGNSPQILTAGTRGFALSVAGAGDLNGDGYDDVVVSDPNFPNGYSLGDGRVYVYFGGPSGLSGTPGWQKGGGTNSGFGCSVSPAGDVDGDTLDDLVIASCNFGAGTGDGIVQVFHGHPGGVWDDAWRTIAVSGGSDFMDVANAGDVNGDGFADVLVGTPTVRDPDGGRAYVFPGSASGLGPSAIWIQDYYPSVWQDRFGHSVGTAGDVNGDGFADIVVGAPFRWDSPHDYEGWAFLYLGSATGPSYNAAWSDQANEYGAEFGHSVGTAGDVNGDGLSDLLIGAYKKNGTSTVDCGAAYVYHGSAAGSLAAGLGISGAQAWARLGYSISGVGDVDGDGYSDFLVGAPYWDGGEADEGRADLYRGNAGGPSSIPSWSQEGNQTSAHFGEATGGAGDVNGDGYVDVLVAAPAYDNGHVDEGKAWLFLGTPGGLQGGPAWSVEGEGTSHLLGTSVAGVGDVNADGFADVAIGEPGHPGTLYANTGRTNVFFGGPTALPASASQAFAGTYNVAAKFGTSVAGAGDVNRDGYSDLVVGAPEDTGGGSASVFHGGPAGLTFGIKIGQGLGSWTRYGLAVASAGDVNGDGFADLVTGAPRYGSVSSYDGRAFLYLGGPGGVTNSAAWTVTGSAGAQLGATLASADVNGDGFTDVLIGEAAVNSYAGRASLYLGSSGGLSPDKAWWIDGGISTGLGRGLAGVGDLNGDGYEDVVVGAAYYDAAAEDGGWWAVYYGNAMNGAAWRPRQWRYDGAGPIASLGASDNPSRFRIQLIGRSAAGRSRIRVQTEVHAQGVPFDLQGTELSSFAWTGEPEFEGSVVQLDVAVSTPGTAPLNWRARVVDTDPYFAVSRWFRLPDGSSTQPDLRSCPYRWRDADGDGYGNPYQATIACVELSGYVANNLDCNDTSAAAFPGYPEICDGLDNDCDYVTDNPAAPSGWAETWTERDGPALRLHWGPVVAATGYDLVRGEVRDLRRFAGDYAAMPLTCFANDYAGTLITDAEALPAGEGRWYLVRPVNCGGAGSYDDGNAAPRDDEIFWNAAHCP